MPQLPCPPLPPGVPIDGGDLPVSSLPDVATEWSDQIQQVPTAPLRDAIEMGQQAMQMEYQRRSRYAACQSDPGRATGEYLDEALEDHGVFRLGTEQDTAYRTRGLQGQGGVVDPNDILAAVNAILAPYTAVSARYAERSDGWFVGDSTTHWSSFVFQRSTSTLSQHTTPLYWDRCYPDATFPALASIPLRQPPGAMPNGDSFGRWFLLRCPDIASLNSNVSAVYNGLQNAVLVGGFFVGNGSSLSDVNMTFLYNFTSIVDDIYASVINAVNNMIGHGIRWTLWVDPYMN